MDEGEELVKIGASKDWRRCGLVNRGLYHIWRVNRIGTPGLPRKQIVRSNVDGDQDLGSPQ